jgi:hypothetical protein
MSLSAIAPVPRYPIMCSSAPGGCPSNASLSALGLGASMDRRHCWRRGSGVGSRRSLIRGSCAASFRYSPLAIIRRHQSDRCQPVPGSQDSSPWSGKSCASTFPYRFRRCQAGGSRGRRRNLELAGNREFPHQCASSIAASSSLSPTCTGPIISIVRRPVGPSFASPSSDALSEPRSVGRLISRPVHQACDPPQ